jgi:hypothetical protein
MLDLAPQTGGRFGAPFLRLRKFGRLALGGACAIYWLPAGAFAVFFGVSMIVEQGAAWPLGLLVVAWGGGGVFGLLAYLAHAIGGASKFNAFCGWRCAEPFGLAWGALAAAPFLLSAFASSDPSDTLIFKGLVWVLAAVLLDSVLILLFTVIDSNRACA